MTPRELLWQYGHAFCPGNYVSGNILTEGQFLTAPENDPAIMAAIWSYQTWFRDDLDRLSYRSVNDGGYRRAIRCDGQMGPLTAEVLHYPRCGCPDYQARDATPEQGNWPDACRQDIAIAWNFDQLPGTDMVRTDRVFETSCGNWNSALDVHMIPDKNASNPKGRITLANLPGSVLADQYLAIGDCSYVSNGRMDRRDWSQEGFPEATRTHEDGHLLGFEHVQSRDATMYPSIHPAGIARNGRPVQADIEEAIRKGYSVRTTPPDPTPGPTPPTVGLTVRGVQEVWEGDRFIGKIQSVPFIDV